MILILNLINSQKKKTVNRLKVFLIECGVNFSVSNIEIVKVVRTIVKAQSFVFSSFNHRIFC